MAFVAPLLSTINKSIKSNYLFLGIIALIILVNQLIYILFYGKFGASIDAVIENLIMTVLGYGVVYFVGIRCNSEKKYSFTHGYFYIVCALLAISYILLTGSSYIVSEYKYPPQLFYLLIGIASSIVLLNVTNKMGEKCFRNNVIVWISKYSLDIYLTHIVVLSMMSWGNKFIMRFWFLNNWISKYLVVMASSILIVYSLNAVKKFFINRVRLKI